MLISFIRYSFFCKDQKQFKQLGKKHKITGWNAYRVVHGKRIKNMRENCVFLDFQRMKKSTDFKNSGKLPKN